MTKVINAISNMFNNRELALGLWFFILVIWMLNQKKIRKSIFDIVKLLFGKALFRMITFMIIYVSIIIFFFYKTNFWDLTILKDTIYWVLGVAFVMLFNANKINKNENYFKQVIADSLKLTILLEFLVNLHSFSLFAEILFLPLMLLLVILHTFSDQKDEHKAVQKLTTTLLSIIGFIYLIYAVYQIIIDFDNFITYNNLRSLLIAPILTVLLLPFIYFIALFMQYETIFIRLNYFNKEDKKSLCSIKYQIFNYSHFNLRKLNNFSSNFPIYKYEDSKEFRSAVKVFKSTLKNEKKR